MKDDNMYEILKEINEWQDTVFTRATPESASVHLRREANELYENPYDAEEMADIFILLAGVAHLAGVDLVKAVEDKMAINRKRLWGKPDAEGVVEHIRLNGTAGLTPEQMEMLKEIILEEGGDE